MDNRQLNQCFAALSTPLLADAFLRLGLPLRVASAGIRPLVAGSHCAGRVLPARHYGSVDVFLEALDAAHAGDVLVIDNGGRQDEGPIGDLIALEAKACGLAAIVVWGCHRDTAELMRIGLPVFSYGACAVGPQRLDARDEDALSSACCGHARVNADDVVFADADGVMFAARADLARVLAVARDLRQRERTQAQVLETGTSLREQLSFRAYLARRSADPSYTFRQHLQDMGGAIET